MSIFYVGIQFVEGLLNERGCFYRFGMGKEIWLQLYKSDNKYARKRKPQ